MHVAVQSVAFKCSGARKIVSAVGLYLSQSIHYLIVFNLDYLLTMTHCNQTDQHTITLHAYHYQTGPQVQVCNLFYV